MTTFSAFLPHQLALGLTNKRSRCPPPIPPKPTFTKSSYGGSLTDNSSGGSRIPGDFTNQSLESLSSHRSCFSQRRNCQSDSEVQPILQKTVTRKCKSCSNIRFSNLAFVKKSPARKWPLRQKAMQAHFSVLSERSSAYSDSSSEADAEQLEEEKRVEKLSHIMQEICSTEWNYVETLKNLSLDFPQFIRKQSLKAHRELVEPDIPAEIAKHLQVLRKLHSDIANQFQARLNCR
ncbi:unnamed protein product [Soboliphyme baturini]|uniref:DH domain-containing protein n=1 Tax=Soboliphyme baturini TaxID=241478 RepID=A0A183J1G8_9BILA|nr:unnamed protein product [Soboliphyme baturini]